VLTSGDVRFLEAAPVLAILVWAIVILFIYVTANSLVVSQLTRFAVLITGINVVVNIVGNVLLLPHFGIKAAAIMTVVSESLQGVFYFYFIWRHITHFRFVSQFIKPLFAALGMAIVLWLIRSWVPLAVPIDASSRHLFLLIANFLIVGGTGFATYIFALWLMRFFTREDIAFLGRFLGRPA
jgi:O-antigen/teichoic acid export membrane protein